MASSTCARLFGENYCLSTICEKQRRIARSKPQWSHILAGEFESRGAIDDLLLQGIDPSIRPQLWQTFAKHGINYIPMYEPAVGRPIDITCIRNDVPRTFSESVSKSHPEKLHELERILNTFTVVDGELGYTQGMNCVLSLLLLHMDEPSAFQTFFCIMNNPSIYLKSFYVPGFPGLFEVSRAFVKLLQQRHKWLARATNESWNEWAAMMARSVLSMLVAYTVPQELKEIMFDRVIVAGKRALVSFQLAIIRLFSTEIQTIPPPDIEIFMATIDERPVFADIDLVLDAWNREWITEAEFAEAMKE